MAGPAIDQKRSAEDTCEWIRQKAPGRLQSENESKMEAGSILKRSGKG